MLAKTTSAKYPDLNSDSSAMKSRISPETKEKGKNFVAGGIAGCCSKTLVAPLDRIKILLQAHNHHYKDLGVWSTLTKVRLKENVSGLYKGNGVHMVKIFPYAGVQFMTYEKSKEFVKVYLHEHPKAGRFIAGSMAGISAVACTYPLDVIRARLAFQVKGEHIYLGLTHAAGTILRQEGVAGLYKGMTPTLLGMVPYAGTAFFSFETLKVACVTYFPDTLGTPCPQDSGGVVLTIPGKSVCGGMAGLFGQTVAYPFDVVKKRIQLAQMLPESQKYNVHWYKIFMIIYKEHGISKGLYRGMSINYMRIIPMQATVFTVYEQLKQWMGMDTCVTR